MLHSRVTTPIHDVSQIPKEFTHNQFVSPYILANWNPLTVKSYIHQFQRFSDWCMANGYKPLPVGQGPVLHFLITIRAEFSASGLSSHLTAIAFFHRLAGYSFDVDAMRQLTRRLYRGTAPSLGPAEAVDIEFLRAIVATLPSTKFGARDAALFLIGFAAALRPSELVSLDYNARTSDAGGMLTIEPDGLRIRLYDAKCDQYGIGLEKLIIRGCRPCPIAAVEHWLHLAEIEQGPVFRSLDRAENKRRGRLPRDVVRLRLKQAAAAALRAQGYSHDAVRDKVMRIRGHSLRAGFVTSAVRAGVDCGSIARHVGWTSPQNFIRYTRFGQVGDLELSRSLLGVRQP